MKIDIHNHILPENWPDLKEKYGYGGWCQINHKSNGTAEMIKDGQHVFRVVERNCYCGKTRVEDMNKTGVAVQALSTVPVMFSYWAKPEDTADFCRFLNDDMAGVISKHPDRFVGLGTLPMQAPELAVEEIKRCKHDLGFAGFEIGSHVNNWNLSAKELWPIYATAQEHDCALFVHPWDMASDKRNSEYWMPWLVGMPTETTMAICSMIFGGVFERFPRLKVCFAHGAGSFPYTCGRIQHGFNCRPDIVAVDNKVPPLSYLNRIYADSLVHDKSALLYLLQLLGDDKVMLGSDYPFPLGEDPAGKLIESLGELTDNQKSKLLYSNAVDFLGLDTTKYLKN